MNKRGDWDKEPEKEEYENSKRYKKHLQSLEIVYKFGFYLVLFELVSHSPNFKYLENVYHLNQAIVQSHWDNTRIDTDVLNLDLISPVSKILEIKDSINEKFGKLIPDSTV